VQAQEVSEEMRRIDYIVVHSTATPEGRHTSLEDVTRWHLARGFRAIGYHYLIELDGIARGGRPLSESGAHVKGHNSNSIGIAYAGGTDAAGKAKDTRTAKQKESLKKLLSDLKKLHPNAEIVGHRDLGATACPSFDAKAEYKDL
jgi:N-acetylmuramoyl-L-alanine amidase